MNRPANGFTLLEVIVSMTIMALVVTVLYTAFSTGIRVWEDQDTKTAAIQERFIVTRLLARDFEQLRPYVFSWEKGKDFFFAGDRNILFYATTSGLAAMDRDKGALFFACAFLERNEDNGTLDLKLFKSPYPTEYLAQALHDFLMEAEGEDGGEDEETIFTLPEELKKKSFVLLGGLDSAGFVINYPERVLLTDENATEEDEEKKDEKDEKEDENATRITDLDDLEDKSWRQDSLPESVQLAFTADGRGYTVFGQVLAAGGGGGGNQTSPGNATTETDATRKAKK